MHACVGPDGSIGLDIDNREVWTEGQWARDDAKLGLV